MSSAGKEDGAGNTGGGLASSQHPSSMLESQADSLTPTKPRGQGAAEGAQSTSGLGGSQARSSALIPRQPAKVENRDHCNFCKDGGELICCDHCPRSFHVGTCLKNYCKKNNFPYHQPPSISDDEDAEWYCPRCRPVVEKRKSEVAGKKQRAEAKIKEVHARKTKTEHEAKERAAEYERKRQEKQLDKEKQD